MTSDILQVILSHCFFPLPSSSQLILSPNSLNSTRASTHLANHLSCPVFLTFTLSLFRSISVVLICLKDTLMPFLLSSAISLWQGTTFQIQYYLSSSTIKSRVFSPKIVSQSTYSTLTKIYVLYQ